MRPALICLFFALPAAALAQPVTLTYQGELTDLAGAPFEGARTLTFRLYADEEGGDALWTERHDDVDVLAGRFTVVLGARQALPGAEVADVDLWLGVQAAGDEEFAPRMRVGGALRARFAATAAQAIRCHGEH